MHLGVACQYPQLAHHNFFFTENAYLNYQQVFHEKVLPDDPTIYLVNTNKTDHTQAPVGYENIKVLHIFHIFKISLLPLKIMRSLGIKFWIN